MDIEAQVRQVKNGISDNEHDTLEMACFALNAAAQVAEAYRRSKAAGEDVPFALDQQLLRMSETLDRARISDSDEDEVDSSNAH